MPVSRRRRPRHPPRARSRRFGGKPGRSIITTSLKEMVENPPSAHDVDCLRRSLDAGARGDAKASLAHELAGSVVVEALHRFVVQDLIDHGDDAPAWAYSRWCADLAYRSMLLAGDRRVDLAVKLVMGALYPDSLGRLLNDEDRLDPVGLKVLGITLAAGDRVVADVALYEFGGLANYITGRAEGALLNRTDRVRDWAAASIGVYEFVDFRGCRLVLRDMVGGDEVHALNLGAMLGVCERGLIGRLVPITADPGLMFVTSPISVDLPTAQAVADAMNAPEPLEWLFALSGAMVDGGWQEGFHNRGTTWFTSDLPVPEVVVGQQAAPEEEAGRIVDLRAKGYSAEMANALVTLEMGLLTAEISDHAAAAFAPNITAMFGTPGLFEAAVRECTGPHTTPLWFTLAEVVPDHVAERCRALARLAEQSSAH